MTVETKHIGRQRVIAMRHIGPYHEIGPVFQRLSAWADINDVPIGRGIAIWHDNPQETPAEKLRSDACFVVDPYFQIHDISVKVVDIPEQTCAVTEHAGSYEGLPGTWGNFMQWFASSGKTYPEGGVTYEMYMNEDMHVPPDQLRTLLFVPVLEESS